VPDSLHIHAYPFISALNIPDFVNHESPANGLIKDRGLPDDLANSHAEGRGFESLQPLLLQTGTFQGARKAGTTPVYPLRLGN
jgi:hypothetical protein